MRSSTPGRWARRIGVPAAAVVAVALVGAPAFAATSTPSKPTPPPGCVVVGKPGSGPVTLPDPGKPGKCVICIVKKHPGDGADSGTGAVGTAGGGEQGTISTGKPVQCPVCPLPPGKPGPTGPGEGAGTVTQPGPGGPDKKCTICIIIKPGQPGGPTTQPGPITTQPVPGKPVKCDPLPGQK